MFSRCRAYTFAHSPLASGNPAGEEKPAPKMKNRYPGWFSALMPAELTCFRGVFFACVIFGKILHVERNNKNKTDKDAFSPVPTGKIMPFFPYASQIMCLATRKLVAAPLRFPDSNGICNSLDSQRGFRG